MNARLKELIERARALRSDADRLAADLRRDGDRNDGDDLEAKWRAEQMANLIDKAVKVGEGAAVDD
jgi:hypothetical protein